jgi:ribosomal protein S18 acetylase RimI-like enzyme
VIFFASAIEQEVRRMVSSMSKFQLRPVTGDDFQFCWLLYRELMKPLTVELLGEWNELGQRRVIEQALTEGGTSIIAVGSADIGWLQMRETRDGLYLSQLYVMPSMQNRGIGTAVVLHLCDRACREAKSLTLDVMKNNRARSLYQRLGFGTIGSSEYKLNMRWEKSNQTSGV